MFIDYKEIATNAIRNLGLAIEATQDDWLKKDRDATIRAWDEIEREAKLQEAREGNAF